MFSFFKVQSTVSCFKTVLFLLVLFSNISLVAQTNIEGVIRDQSDSTAVPFVSVILYKYQSNTLLTYTQTDERGFYSLSIPSEPTVVSLKTTRLGYHQYQQDIVIGSDKQTTIAHSFLLTPKDAMLKEVVIQGPIIVKEDTIVYDIAHWTERHDQMLEEVLAKIPGFRILGNGQIEVNGKAVNKVIIDGEEMTDTGAAILTRSIAPEDVESIEVRLDEENAKLKESLLDATEYVVLDIKLKKDLKKALFGKWRATLGHQQGQFELGGYLNAFSLKKKFKLHVFAEHDRFGEQTISLKQIKNIGAEAWQKIFETPADFQALTEREAFDDEIYGFKDYTQSWKDIIGISAKATLSPAIDLYIGSYNASAKDRKERGYTQTFANIPLENAMLESQQITDYSTKNKLEFRFDKDKVKAKLDLNLVAFDNTYQSLNQVSSQNLAYAYGNQNRSLSLYENMLIEYKHSDKLGFQLKAGHSYISSDYQKDLFHNDESYLLALAGSTEGLAFDFNQEVNTTANNFLAEWSVYHTSKLGVIQSGIFFQSKEQSTSKLGLDREAENGAVLGLFTALGQELGYQQYGALLDHQIHKGKWSFNNSAKLISVYYPVTATSTETQTMLNYKLGFNYTPSGFNYIGATLTKGLTPFPFEKLMQGADIVSFQTVLIPNLAPIQPRPEMTLELSGAKKFDDLNLLFDPMFLYGKTQQGNRYLLNDNALVTVGYDQLTHDYILLTLPLIKNFKMLPIRLAIEPEWLVDRIENIDQLGNSYYTTTYRRLLGIKLNTVLEDKPYSLFVHPKLSSFTFVNGLADSKTKQNMLSVDMNASRTFFEDRWLVAANIRRVVFWGSVQSSFTNTSLRIQYASKNTRCFMAVDNLFNNLEFVKQEVYPIYFSSNRHSVFARYIKIGFEHKL